MNTPLLRILLSGAVALTASCASTKQQDLTVKEPVAVKKSSPKGSSAAAPKAGTDELDDYETVEVSDPLQPINRAMFKVNDGLYTVIFRPIAKGYEFVFPKPVRKGIDNVFENVKFPVRFVNSALQGRFQRAGHETGKFLVNTIGGLGGIFRLSDKVPTLVDLPAEDTGQTLAKWGVGHGPYIVLPLLGPGTAREAVGLCGDIMLNPVNWGFLWKPGGVEQDWTLIPPYANSLRLLPEYRDIYDAATKDAVDPYISARSAFIQNRSEAAKK